MAVVILSEREYGAESHEPLCVVEEAFFDPPNTEVFHGAILGAEGVLRYELEVPEHIAYDGIVGVITGLGGFQHSALDFRNALATLGFPTFTYDRDLAGGSFLDPHGVHAHTLARVVDDIRSRVDIQNRARSSEDGFDLGRVLYVAHSMGGLIAARSICPDDLPDAIINYASVGYGSPPLVQRIQSVPGGISHTLRDSIEAVMNNGHIGPNIPTLGRLIAHFARAQALPEIVSCARSSVLSSVTDARERGVLVSYGAGEFDGVVPACSTIAQHVDAYAVAQGLGHLAPIGHPEETAVVVKQQARELGLVT